MVLTTQMTMQALYQKQGRSAQFASVAERDKWLRDEIRKLHEAQSKTGSTRRAVQDATASLNSELTELSQVCCSTALSCFVGKQAGLKLCVRQTCSSRPTYIL